MARGLLLIGCGHLRPTLLAAACLLIGIASFPSMGSAQAFDVPEGFVVDEVASDPATPDRLPLLRVQPANGPFSELSLITLGRVADAVAEPDAWLMDRVTGDIAGAAGAAEGLLDSPDSPFADPAFNGLREAVPRLLSGLESLSRLPLSFCDEPREAYNAAGAMRELYCVFQLGPLRQYLVMRLQEVDGTWYYTDIRSMNERRLRHLIAIANSFSVGAGASR